MCATVKVQFTINERLRYIELNALCVIAFYFSTIHNLSDCFPVALSRNGATISMMIPRPENVVSSGAARIVQRGRGPRVAVLKKEVARLYSKLA